MIKKIIYFILGVFIFLIIIFSGIFFYLNKYPIRSEYIARQLSKIVSEKTGATLNIGSTQIYVFRQIHLNNVELKTKNGTVIAVDNAFLNYSFLPLAQKRLIGDILLQNVSIMTKQQTMWTMAGINIRTIGFENITSDVLLDETKLLLSDIKTEASILNIYGNLSLKQEPMTKTSLINAKFDIIFYPQKIKDNSVPTIFKQIFSGSQTESIKFLLEISGDIQKPKVSFTPVIWRIKCGTKDLTGKKTCL